jgi:uncharacterized protein (TIGR00251 family)
MGGMYVKLRVTAGAKTEEWKRVKPDHFTVKVKEPAEGNRANRRVLELAREHFAEQDVRIISGHHSPSKILAVGR